MSKIFKPRRGKASTMAGSKKTTVLAAGEFFMEVPDTGVGTGKAKIKMGDGATQYSSLPYALGDTSTDKINLNSNSATTVAAALNSMANGNTLGTQLGAAKQACILLNNGVTKLNEDLPFKFGIDNDGNYGYYKAGADTVTPFKTGTGNDIFYKIYFVGSGSYPAGYIETYNVGNEMTSKVPFGWNERGICNGLLDFEYPQSQGNGSLLAKRDLWVDGITFCAAGEYIFKDIFCGNIPGKSFIIYEPSAYINPQKNESIILRKTLTANTDEFNFKNLGHARLRILSKCTVTSMNVGVQVLGANTADELSHGKNCNLISQFRLKKANIGVDQYIDTDISYPYIVIYPIYGGTWGSTTGNIPVEIEVYSDNTEGILPKIRTGYNLSCYKVESAKRTITFGDNMETIIHRSATTKCTGSVWSATKIDLSKYKHLIIDYTVDQAGDSSNGYTNKIGFSANQPTDAYSTDFIWSYDLGNDVKTRQTVKLDISNLTGEQYLKIVAGAAGFIIYRMLLTTE